MALDAVLDARLENNLLINASDGRRVSWSYDRTREQLHEVIATSSRRRFRPFEQCVEIDSPLPSKILHLLANYYLDGCGVSREDMHCIDCTINALKGDARFVRILHKLISAMVTFVDLDNCIRIWRLCKRHSHTLTAKVESYITYNLCGPIRKRTIDFYRLTVDELEQFLAYSKLNIVSEEDVVEVIDDYIRGDLPARLVHVPRLYKNVRTKFVRMEEQDPRLALVHLHGSSSLPHRIPRDEIICVGGAGGGSIPMILDRLSGISPPVYEASLRFDQINHKWNAFNEFFLPDGGVYNHAAVVLDGILYIIGGADKNDMHLKQMWKYSTGQWRRCADMFSRRANIGGSTVVFNGNIYVFGGNEMYARRLAKCEMYDVKLDRWIPLSDMPNSRADAAACVVDNKIYISGGFSGRQLLASIDVFCPQTNSWLQGGNLPKTLTGHVMTFANDSLEVYGGFNGKERTNEIVTRRLSPNAPWIAKSRMLTARSGFSLLPIGHCGLLAVGGCVEKGCFAEYFDGCSWSVVSVPKGEEREGARAVVIPDFVDEFERLTNKNNNNNN